MAAEWSFLELSLFLTYKVSIQLILKEFEVAILEKNQNIKIGIFDFSTPFLATRGREMKILTIPSS